MFGGKGPKRHEYEFIIKGFRPKEKADLFKKWDDIEPSWRELAERLIEENRAVVGSRQIVYSWVLLEGRHAEGCEKFGRSAHCSCGYDIVKDHILEETENGEYVLGAELGYQDRVK